MYAIDRDIALLSKIQTDLQSTRREIGAHSVIYAKWDGDSIPSHRGIHIWGQTDPHNPTPEQKVTQSLLNMKLEEQHEVYRRLFDKLKNNPIENPIIKAKYDLLIRTTFSDLNEKQIKTGD
jgi:hypothetical protein